MIGHRPAQRRALTALLLLVCILAGGMLALQRAKPDLLVLRMAGGQVAPPPGQTPANGPAAGQPAVAPPPESRFAVIALRPLFTAGRRPADQPETLAAVSPGGAPTDLLVTGIVSAGADSVAIIEPVRPGPQADPALVVRVGDTVAGWTVEAIEPGRVVLVRDGERHEMPLVAEDDPRRPQQRPRLTPGAKPPQPGPPVPATPRLQRAPAQPAVKR